MKKDNNIIIDSNDYSWINSKIPRTLHTQFATILRAQGISIKNICVDMITKYVNEHEHVLRRMIYAPQKKDK